jgi:hypothetical protein
MGYDRRRGEQFPGANVYSVGYQPTLAWGGLMHGGNSQRAGAKTDRAQAHHTQIHGPQENRDRESNHSQLGRDRGQAGATAGIKNASYRGRRQHQRGEARATGGVQDSTYFGVDSG